MTSWKAFPLVLLLLLGCTTDSAPKTSHFEHDHVVATHWPSDLEDVATKIRERLVWLGDGVPASRDDDEHDHEHRHDHDHEHQDGHGPRIQIDPAAEIAEIVSWIPEIAADTNLAEADWLPLYHATESLTANLRATDFLTAGGKLTHENRRQLESLCVLVEESARKIPEQLSILAKEQS